MLKETFLSFWNLNHNQWEILTSTVVLIKISLYGAKKKSIQLDTTHMLHIYQIWNVNQWKNRTEDFDKGKVSGYKPHVDMCTSLGRVWSWQSCSVIKLRDLEDRSMELTLSKMMNPFLLILKNTLTSNVKVETFGTYWGRWFCVWEV